ncbi:hypothetical protein NKG94_01605 [Micromonospora sp. M12]
MPPAQQTAPTQPAYQPVTQPGVGAGGGGASRRLRSEAGDAWGISTALFLGSAGAAAGYVASSAVGPAAASGAVTFVVVYLVRLLVATAVGAFRARLTGAVGSGSPAGAASIG